MAKDGSLRGGARIGAGKKPEKTKICNLDGTAAEMNGKTMPKLKNYLGAKQPNGKPFGAKRIFKDMYEYLVFVGCESFVPVGLIEQYSVCVARWIQCEEAVTEHGFLAKHPTTGGAMATPFATMSQDYMAQANRALVQIMQIVKENQPKEQPGHVEENDLIKKLKARIV